MSRNNKGSSRLFNQQPQNLIENDHNQLEQNFDSALPSTLYSHQKENTRLESQEIEDIDISESNLQNHYQQAEDGMQQPQQQQRQHLNLSDGQKKQQSFPQFPVEYQKDSCSLSRDSISNPNGLRAPRNIVGASSTSRAQQLNSYQERLKPNIEQERIIYEKKECHLEIKACAGSGKTTTILRRVKHLIEFERADPQRILITAFNIDAARSVKEKLQRLVSERIEKQVTVNNIDKLSKLWVSTTKRFNMDTLHVREYTTKLVSVMKSDAAFLARITDLFDYIFFDEFQDINPDEYELLCLFASRNTVITFVGDDAQNIYSFRESKAEVSPEQLREDFPGIVQHSLTMNYRSSQPIVEFANQIIANSRYQNPTANTSTSKYPSMVMTSARGVAQELADETGRDKPPEFTRFMSVSEQNESIINTILELLEVGFKLDSIAVLSRTNKPLQFLEEALEIYNNKLEKQKVISNNNSNTNYLQSRAVESESTNYGGATKKVPLPFIAHISDNKEKYAKGVKLLKSNNQVPVGAPSGSYSSHSSGKKLTLTTIHKSKGLEWDVVFLIGLNDDFFPGTNKDKEEEEERRVFYVGVTRAKLRLEMSFIWSKKNKNITRFITEVNTKFYSGFNQGTSTNQPRCNEQMRIVDKLKSKTIQLAETIEFLTKDHYEELRRLGCLQIPKQTMQIHFKCNLGQYIIENNLIAEFASFFKTYILRSISEEITRDSSSLEINPSNNNNNKSTSDSQKSSSKNAGNNNSNNNNSGFSNKFCEAVLFSSSGLSAAGGAGNSAGIPTHMLAVPGASGGISSVGSSEYLTAAVDMTTSTYIQNQSKREEILRSLIAFQDKSIASDSILKHIYNVAMCTSIFNQRKRLLHKDDAFKYFELNKNILRNARKTFLPEVFKAFPIMNASICSTNTSTNKKGNSKLGNLCSRFDDEEEEDVDCEQSEQILANILVNESMYSDKFQLKADFDVITAETIFEIRFQQNQLLTPEDTIELLAKAAIYTQCTAVKSPNSPSRTPPRYLVVYYPLQGELITLDILNHSEKLDSILSILFAARLERQEACAADMQSRSGPSSAQGSQIVITKAMLDLPRSDNNAANLGERGGHEEIIDFIDEKQIKLAKMKEKRNLQYCFEEDSNGDMQEELKQEEETRESQLKKFQNIGKSGNAKDERRKTTAGITKSVLKNRENTPARNSESAAEYLQNSRNKSEGRTTSGNNGKTGKNDHDNQVRKFSYPSKANVMRIPAKPDSTMMKMITRPTIGGKAEKRTTTKADSCEYFRSKYGQFPSKYGNSNHPF